MQSAPIEPRFGERTQRSTAGMIAFVIVLCIVLAITILIVRTMQTHRYGFGDTMSTILIGTDTRYAPGFTEDAFDLLKIGDTRQRVVELLGPPLPRPEMGRDDKVWYYSESPTSTHYHFRCVVFEDDVVSELERSFYFD